MADYIFPYGEAPDDANYVLSEGPDPNLPNADVLVPGANISITVGQGTVTISSTGGGTDNATFITATDETADLPNSFQAVAGANVTLDYIGNQLIISSTASGGGGGSVTSVSSGAAAPLFTTNVATATTTPAISYTLSNAASGSFFAGPASGTAAPGSYRFVLGTDLIGALTAGTNITLTPAIAPGSRLTIALAPGVDSTFIADGSVTNTEFQYLNGATSNIQDQLNAKQPLSSTLNALASSLTGTGYIAQTGPDTFAERTFQGSSNVTVTNPAGIAGDSVLDVTARVFTVATSSLLNALSSSTAGGQGGIYQLSDTAFINRSLTGTTNRVVITNPLGLAGAPTFDVGSDVYTISSSNVLNDLASSTSTGIVVQSDSVGHHVYRSIDGTTGEINVTNPSGVGGNPTLSLDSSVYTDRDSSVLNALATGVNGTGFLAQNGASFADRTLTGTAGRVTITNPTGATSDPVFDVGTDVYVTGDITALPGIQIIEAGGTLQIGASGAQGGTLTSVGNIDPLWTTNVTGPSVTYVLNQLASGEVLIGPKDGIDDEPSLRRLLGQDLTSALVEGSNVTLTLTGDQIEISSTAGGSGTVTEVIVGDLPPVFTSVVTDETTTPTVAYTLTQQASGTFFAGPESGAIDEPTFRTIVGSDVFNALDEGSNITLTLVGDKVVIAASGSTGYTTIEDEGTPLTQRDTINFVGAGIVASDDSGGARTQVTLDATLNALASFSATGIMVSQGSDTFVGREIAGTPSQVTVANGNGIPGDITIGLDSGINVNLLADGSVSNTEFQYLDGTSSNIQAQIDQKQPLSSTLNALASSLSGTGYVVQTGPNAFAERTLQGASNRLTITNPAGIAGDSVLDVGTDVLVVGDVTALPGIQIVNGSGIIQIGASGALGGTVTDITVGDISPLWDTNVSTSTTTPSVTYTLNAIASGASLLGPKDGVDDEPTLRRILGQDLTDALVEGSNVTITLVGDQLEIASTAGGSGTVTEVTAQDLAPVFTTVVNDGTTTPDIVFTLTQQASGTVFRGPTSGADDDPVFGRLINTDLPLEAGTNITLTPNGDATVVALGSGIDAAKIADGSVSSTEFQYLDGVTSDIQVQLDNKQPLSGVLNALASSLTGTGYVIQNGPDSFVERSLATANSNHVTITNPSGVAGASTFDIGSNVYTNETHSLLNYLASSPPNLGEISMGASDNSYILTKPNAGAGVQLDFANGIFTISATGAGSSGYNLIQEEGSNLAQRATIDFVGTGITASDTGAKTQVSLDDTLNSLAAYNTNGILTQTATDIFTGRTITGTANVITVTNGNGVSGNPTLTVGSLVVRTDQANTYSSGAQSFASVTTTLGAVTLSGTITPSAAETYDIGTANVGIRDIYLGGTSSFTTRITKTTPSADRTFTIPNADSVAVVGDAGASNNFLTAISPTTGVITKAQPAFSNLSGAATNSQLPTVDVSHGGLGITSTPTNGQIPIGNGTNYVAAAITAGTGVTVTNGSGSITVAAKVPIAARKNADTSRTNDTLTADPDLSIPVGANESWTFIADFVVLTTSNTPDFKFCLTGPSGATVTWNAYNMNIDNRVITYIAATAGGTPVVVDMVASQPRLIHLTGTVSGTYSAGNVTLDWAQNVTNAGATVLKAAGSMVGYPS